MLDNRFKITRHTCLVTLRRGNTKLVNLRFKNIGVTNWTDPSVKSENTHTVGGIINEEEKNDFNLRWGNRGDEKANRRFENVYRKFYSRNGRRVDTVHPGESVKLQLRIEARKFATKGLHSLKFALYERSRDKTSYKKIAGKPEAIYVIVIPEWQWFKNMQNSIKLMIIKPGKVDSEFLNPAFINQKENQVTTPVVMAFWQRKQNLKRIIRCLENQTQKTAFYIWNNNRNQREYLNEIAEKSELPIYIIHSKFNIGGFGRFYLARQLTDKYQAILFIDDDQFPESEYVEKMQKEFKKHTIKSQWAFNFPNVNNYWHKRLVDKGESADYCGTGGMISDSSIFMDPGLFDCPRRYWFIEDLWLSYYARYVHKWKLERSVTDLEIQEDGKDQFTGMIDLKTKFLKYLTKRFH